MERNENVMMDVWSVDEWMKGGDGRVRARVARVRGRA